MQAFDEPEDTFFKNVSKPLPQQRVIFNRLQVNAELIFFNNFIEINQQLGAKDCRVVVVESVDSSGNVVRGSGTLIECPDMWGSEKGSSKRNAVIEKNLIVFQILRLYIKSAAFCANMIKLKNFQFFLNFIFS